MTRTGQDSVAMANRLLRKTRNAFAVSIDQQAMWDAMRILGYDTNGEETPAAFIAGSGRLVFISEFLRLIKEVKEGR